MFEQLTSSLFLVEDFLWIYFCLPFIVILGLLFTYLSKAAQIRHFPAAFRNFFQLLRAQHVCDGKVNPINAFFACVGGCVGIGNVVAVCTAVSIGGPGALLWLWLTASTAVMLKYSEVYLGLRYRITDAKGGYKGGPMYYLQQVFSGKTFPILAAVLLCLYGVEVYQFNVVASSISLNFDVPKILVVGVLLCMVIYAGLGGITRVGAISSRIIPLFVIVYCGMGAYVILLNADKIPSLIQLVFTSAFSGHAAVGGFVGSTLMVTISQGLRRACYSGDIGIGYASVIHSESAVKRPEKQASLVIVEIFIDTFVICTTTILLILVTGVWDKGIPQELMVQHALATVFSHIEWFMPVLILLLGYSTINAYFVVGLTCAQYLAGKKGRLLYILYACAALLFFSFEDPTLPQTVMTIVGGMLLLLNCYGIYKLRHEISYDFHLEEIDEAIERKPALEQA